MNTLVPTNGSELSPPLQNILRLAQAALPLAQGAILLVEGGVLRVRALLGDAPPSPLVPREPLWARVRQQRWPILTPPTDARVPPDGAETPTFALAVPICWGPTVIGMIELLPRPPSAFDAQHLELAKILADQAALVVAHSHPLEPTWFDLSFSPSDEQRGEAEETMRALRERTEDAPQETELHEQRARLHRQLGQHRALYEVGSQITAEFDLPKLLNTLMQNLRTLFAVDGLSLLMPDGSTGTFTQMSALGLSDSYLAVEQSHHAVTAAGEAATHRRPVLITDIAQDERMAPLHEAARREGLSTALVLPFVYHSEVVALLTLYHRQPYPYGLEEMELLSIFVNHATSAIKNVQFYSSIMLSRSRLNAILHSMTDGVIALDAQERVIFANPPASYSLGLAPETRWIGHSSQDVWATLHARLKQETGAPALAPILTQADGVVGVEVETLDPPRTLELVHAPILDESGHWEGRLLLLHDITELRASERLKDELIALLSHELRTPLTSILGYSKLLVDRPTTDLERRTRWATHILNKSRLLGALLNDVLDLSRLNRRRFTIERRPTDLGALLARVVAAAQSENPERTITVETTGDLAALPLDEERIEQLLNNLLRNALTYSPDGGPIVVRAHQEEALLLEVSDQGIGIHPADQEAIFEPFFRVDTRTTRDSYGTGLGLPLCRGIAQAHGGEITVESALGHGSIFRVRIPVVSSQ